MYLGGLPELRKQETIIPRPLPSAIPNGDHMNQLVTKSLATHVYVLPSRHLLLLAPRGGVLVLVRGGGVGAASSTVLLAVN